MSMSSASMTFLPAGAGGGSLPLRFGGASVGSSWPGTVGGELEIVDGLFGAPAGAGADAPVTTPDFASGNAFGTGSGGFAPGGAGGGVPFARMPGNDPP